MEKFDCYYKNDFGDEYRAFARQEPDGDWYRVEDVDARISELEKYEHAVKEHNEQCQQRCGVGDQEAVRCKYRPYFEKTGRRCPDCPVHEKIHIELMVSCSGD